MINYNFFLCVNSSMDFTSFWSIQLHVNGCKDQCVEIFNNMALNTQSCHYCGKLIPKNVIKSYRGARGLIMDGVILSVSLLSYKHFC